MKTINLTAPHILPATIKQHITCIRPKRIGGARIEVEKLHDKTIIHNYGHGGFGWSLLPGSVMHSITLLEETIKSPLVLRSPQGVSKDPMARDGASHLFTTNGSKNEHNITVIGAGCMGLLTALLLHEKGFNVTIIAEQKKELTSHKAAGSFSVIAMKSSKENQPLMDQMAVDSYCFYQNAYQQNHPLFAGVKPVPVYMIHEGSPNYRYPMVTAGVMNEPEEVMVNFGKTSYKANKFDTFFIGTTTVMEAFMSKIHELNIPMVQKKIHSFEEIEDEVIFNCSGLGSQTWDPSRMVPVQGHAVMLQHQPLEDLQYILNAHIKINSKTREISWTPKNGGMLGGTAFNFQDNLAANADEGNKIIERAKIFFNGLT